ncbi:MAG: alpha/beta hydrolase-fold protein [Ferruginibacter sp.]
MKRLLLYTIVIACSVNSYAQELQLYKKHIFISNGDTIRYRLLLPEHYDASKKYPLVYFLHGAGERGSDNESQLMNGGRLFANDSSRKNYPAIVVFPQCPKNSFWSNVSFRMDTAGRRQFIFSDTAAPTRAMVMAQELLTRLLTTYPVEKTQVYAAGLSMGGMGTYEIVNRNPGVFAAAIAICGGGNPATAKQMKGTSWWIFHGAKDDVVPPALSQQMYEALINVEAKARYTVYPEADHNSWDAAFAEPSLLPWLFSQHR